MNVIAFNGSARKNGNTAILINHVLKELKNEGIGAEMVQLAGSDLKGCQACGKCGEMKNGKCVIDGDPLNSYISLMVKADGIILGSPTYFADVTSNMKSLIDRAGYVNRANGDLLRRKVGAAVIAVRRAGAIHAFDTINHFFTIGQMIIPGSCYWNVGLGRKSGEVEQDEEGIKTMEILGQNMAWLLKKLHS